MNWLSSIAAFFYPAICPSCEESIELGESICRGCVSQLELVDPVGRCPRCFSKEYSSQKRLCARCMARPPEVTGAAAATLYQGLSSSLVLRLKYGNEPELADTLAAMMVLQWERLGWEQPDYLVPVPMVALRSLFRGYNQAALLARALGRFLEVPVVDLLGRRMGELPQAGKKRKERLCFDRKTIYQRRPIPSEKRLLLIDDVATTGTTLSAAARALYGSYPRSIHALTFSLAE